MTAKEMNEKLHKLYNDESFLKRMSTAESKEDVKSIFSEYGLTLSDEELNALISLAANEAEEVTIDKLEHVAGGSAIGAWEIFSTSYSVIKDIAKSCWNFGKKCASWF